MRGATGSYAHLGASDDKPLGGFLGCELRPIGSNELGSTTAIWSQHLLPTTIDGAIQRVCRPQSHRVRNHGREHGATNDWLMYVRLCHIDTQAWPWPPREARRWPLTMSGQLTDLLYTVGETVDIPLRL